MGKRLIKPFITLAFISILSLSSCSTKTENQDVEPLQTIENSKVEHQNTEFDGLTILIRRTTTLNPLLTEDESVKNALHLLYQNIISYTDDNKIQLNLIESYQYAEDTNTFTIKIKPNVRWDDNVKSVSADDFVYSYETLKNAPDEAVYKPIIEDIVSFRKIDPLTIEVKTNTPSIGNPYFLAFPVIPEHCKKNEGTYDEVHLNQVVGNGVYKNSSISVNNTIFLEDNDLDDKNPNIKNVKLQITDNSASNYYAFEQDISNILVSKVEMWSKYHTNKSVNINPYNKMEMIVLGFNFNNDFCRDINFRKTVYSSIPFGQIANSIYLGFCNESRTILPNNHFAYNKNIKVKPYDLQEASDFLIQTSYGGATMKMIVQGDSLELNKTAQIIRENLQNVGVNIEIVNLTYDDFIEALQKKDYDLYLGDFKMEVLPDYSNLFGAKNYSGYVNEGLVNQINSAKVAKSYEEYKQILDNMQNIVFNEKPIIPIIHNNDAIISNQNITTTKPTSYDNPFEYVEKWETTN